MTRKDNEGENLGRNINAFRHKKRTEVIHRKMYQNLGPLNLFIENLTKAPYQSCKCIMSNPWPYSH